MEKETEPTSPSGHCMTRMKQRGITRKMAQLVMENGNAIYKQGLKFHYVTKAKAEKLGPFYKESIANLIVITDSNEKVIIT